MDQELLQRIAKAPYKSRKLRDAICRVDFSDSNAVDQLDKLLDQKEDDYWIPIVGLPNPAHTNFPENRTRRKQNGLEYYPNLDV